MRDVFFGVDNPSVKKMLEKRVHWLWKLIAHCSVSDLPKASRLDRLLRDGLALALGDEAVAMFSTARS